MCDAVGQVPTFYSEFTLVNHVTLHLASKPSFSLGSSRPLARDPLILSQHLSTSLPELLPHLPFVTASSPHLTVFISSPRSPPPPPPLNHILLSLNPPCLHCLPLPSVLPTSPHLTTSLPHLTPPIPRPQVNVLRTSFWMVYGCVEEDAVEPHRLRESDRSAAEKQLSRRRRLLALLERRRESLVEKRRPFRAAYRWGKMPAAEKMQVSEVWGKRWSLLEEGGGGGAEFSLGGSGGGEGR